MSNDQLPTGNAQLPKGYKQTEVGVIPEDWEVRKIGSLGDVVRGASPRPAGNPKFFNGTYIPWLTVAALTNIPQHQLHVYETYGGLTEEGSKHSRTLEKGTVIIANSGATLGVAKLLYIKCCANDGIAAIINQKYGNKLFICYYINTKTKDLRDVVATGNGQPNLNTTLIKEIAIPLPLNEEEQRSIAQALFDVDALIAALERAIAKKRAIKTATMQQLLTGKKRLPGFGEGKGDRQTEIGLIPEDWEVVTYGEHFNIISGLGFKKSEYREYGVSLLRIDNVSYGDIAWDSVAFLPPEYIGKYKDLVINQDDILLALNRPITNGKLKIAVAKESDVPAILYQPVGKIIFTSQKYDKHYAFYLLSKFIKQFVEESSVGSDQPFISTNNLKKYKIVLPLEIEEQRAIATVLSDMDAEIAALEARLAKTQSIKQGMMQELLTGRTRLV